MINLSDRTLAKAPSMPANIATSTDSQRTTFENLPLELRQDIYLCVAGDLHKREIYVEFTLSGHVAEESGTLYSPALELLSRLHHVSEHYYHEAFEYLTSISVLWVFVSEAQPHKYLLRALREGVHKKVLQHITRVRFARVTIMGHTQPSLGKLDGGSHDELLKIRPLPAYLNYLGVGSTRSPVGQRIYDGNGLRMKVENDIAYGFTLLPLHLPALRRLHIELDILDCLTGTNFCGLLDQAIRRPHARKFYFFDHTSMIADLVRIGHLRSAGMIEVQIHWRDFGFRGRMVDNRILTDELFEKLQVDLIERLRDQMPVRRIVCEG